MKKVFSVLLAGAMVMGMSVTAFADKSFGAKTDNSNDVDVSSLYFTNEMIVVHADGESEVVAAGTNYKNMQPGDDLYFALVTKENKTVVDESNLTCQVEADHEHSDECYTLICEKDEHTHVAGECETVFQCGKDEHKHLEKPTEKFSTNNNECWNKWDVQKQEHILTCTIEEHNHEEAGCVEVYVLEAHTHSAVDAENGCYELECTKEVGHDHVDACYGTKEVVCDVAYSNSIDKDWSINIKGNEYVEDATFYTCKKGNTIPWDKADKFTAADDEVKMIKVELVEDLDELDSQNVKFKLYIADHSSKNKISDKVTLNYSFANGSENKVDFDWTNDVDSVSRWEASKKGTAVFDFNDKAFFTVNMIKDEEVLFNLDTSYDKDIDKAFNEYDADLSFLNFKGSKDEFTKKGELFIPSAKDNKFIYEVVDGKLVAVEAEYDASYKVGGVGTKKGYVIETYELGYYVIADEELVIAEEEVKTETSAPEKANPETGAADFTGAAVAMAVVSVIAVGALAMKR